jgi:hypothetical protein
MTIQRRRIYSTAEVDRIVRASETRPSRQGAGPTGHTGQRHVLITNEELIDRGDAFNQNPNVDLPLACAFSGTPEAVRAVTEALNSPQGQAALQHLDENYPTGIRVRIEAGVPPLVARYSSGFGIKRTAVVTSVLVLAERIEEEAYDGLHIHTAFPVLAFRRGQPAWLDSRGQWH